MAEEPDETPPEEPINSPEEEFAPPEDPSALEEAGYEGGEPAEEEAISEETGETAEGEVEEELVSEEVEVVTLAGPEVEDGDTLLQPCINCSTMLDVGDLEPFAKIHCPICGTAMRVRTQLKNFTLVEVLGAGGMGAVYKALDTNLNRMVALKVVRKEFSADAEYLGKFEREARITASVTHPNVVKVYSFGSDHGLFYIAMELVDKGSLDDLMNLQGRVAEIQALAVGIQVAQGLQAAHQKGLIHRDVKPGNILFADAQTAKIVDFGLALLAEHEAEERGEVWGTPYYVAPEKLDHSPEDFRSDMYSLGGTLFHAIAGRPPFEADTASMVALKHLKSRPVSLQAFAPDVSSATAYVINRTLNKDPEARYQSYTELIEHLEYARSQLLDASTRPRKPKQRVVVESKGQQNLFGVITLVLILLMIGAGAGLYIYRNSIFGHHDTVTSTTTASTEDPEAAAKKMHDELDAARKLMLAGDYAGSMNALRDLDDESDLTQPFQNWITVNEGLAALLQENLKDAQGWFRVVGERAKFSTDPSNKPLVDFFTKVSSPMKGNATVSPSVGTDYALDNEEALAPLIFGLKDWNLGKFEDSGRLLALYLASTPQAPYKWVADYKPLVQKFADNEAAYEKLGVAAAAADTPEKRAAVVKQMQDLAAQVKGALAARLARMEQNLVKKGVPGGAADNQQAGAPAPAPAATAATPAAAEAGTTNSPAPAASPEAAPATAEASPAPAASPDTSSASAPAPEAAAAPLQPSPEDVAALTEALHKYAGACSTFRFDDAQIAVQGVTVSSPDGVKAKDELMKKILWLRQFKALLIQDINSYGYPDKIVTRTGAVAPDGDKKATDNEVFVQTQFGAVPFEWTAIAPSQILTMAVYYQKETARTAPAITADREWLNGVYACEEGLSKDGHAMLNDAAQAKDAYKAELGLFPGGN